MMRRGDGIGIEVLPDALRGVRLQQDAPGRVAKVAGVACDTNNDLLLLDGLTRLRSLLDEAGQPTRVCMWRHDSYIQSLDITGWSTTELNLHRSKLVDVSATIEMASSARRLLAHIKTDMIRHRRVERFVRQAGFDLESIEPTPIAIAASGSLLHHAIDRQPRRGATVDGGRARSPRAGGSARHRGQPGGASDRAVGNQLVGLDRRTSRAVARPGTAGHDRQSAGRHGGVTWVSVWSATPTRSSPIHILLGVRDSPARSVQRSRQPGSPVACTNCSLWLHHTRSATTVGCGSSNASAMSHRLHRCKPRSGVGDGRRPSR